MEWGSIKKGINDNKIRIEFLILIVLLVFLIFGIGYLFGRYDSQEPLEIIEDFNL